MIDFVKESDFILKPPPTYDSSSESDDSEADAISVDMCDGSTVKSENYSAESVSSNAYRTIEEMRQMALQSFEGEKKFIDEEFKLTPPKNWGEPIREDDPGSQTEAEIGDHKWPTSKGVTKQDLRWIDPPLEEEVYDIIDTDFHALHASDTRDDDMAIMLRIANADTGIIKVEAA